MPTMPTIGVLLGALIHSLIGRTLAKNKRAEAALDPVKKEVIRFIGLIECAPRSDCPGHLADPCIKALDPHIRHCLSVMSKRNRTALRKAWHTLKCTDEQGRDNYETEYFSKLNQESIDSNRTLILNRLHDIESFTIKNF